MVFIKTKLKPIKTPNFILEESKPGSRDKGFVEGKKHAVADLDRETIIALCEQFKSDMLQKAGY